MGEYQNVKVSVEDRVGVLTINHPPVNALNTQTVKDLDAAFDELTANPDVKVIIITGAGQLAFVAGADITELAQLKDKVEAKKVIMEGHRVFCKIEASAKPVIAAINAVALGGGMEISMACHIRIASDRARFGQPEINLGITPGWGGTQRLPRLVGKGRALEILLTGDMINAQEAYRIGLVNKVVPASQVLKQAMNLAKKMASKSALPTAAILKVVREGLEMPLAEALEAEADQFSALVESHDAAEGIKAFLEKRQPKFEDR